MPDPERLEEESPVRLRECLDALARASERDIYRVEIVATRTGLKLFVTASPDIHEEAIVRRILAELRPYFEVLQSAQPEEDGNA